MLVNLYGVSLDGWAALNVAIQFVLPAIVGLVTTKLTGRKVQFVLLLVLTLIATVATQELQAHDAGLPLNLVQVIITAVINFAVSLLSHYKVWKPTNLTDLLLSIFVTTPATPPVTPGPLDPAPAAAARHLAVVPDPVVPAPAVVAPAVPAPVVPAPVVDPATVVSQMAG